MSHSGLRLGFFSGRCTRWKIEQIRVYCTDPRLLRSREAMVAAATALLTDGGLEAVTHQTVATRAGAGRATVYRHWPSLLDLRLAALEAGMPPSLRYPRSFGPLRATIRERISFTVRTCSPSVGTTSNRGPSLPRSSGVHGTTKVCAASGRRC
ncbi:TetR/AcrR family transcriptional regulator [Streptomyces sp. NPDC002172]